MGPMRRLAETLPFLRGRRGQARMELPDEVWDAAAKGDSLTTMAWLHTGGHADARLDDEDGAGGTLLLCAASGGRLPLVDMLLRHGASLDLQNYIGWTALMGAAFEGSVEVVRRLLECGRACWHPIQSVWRPRRFCQLLGATEGSPRFARAGGHLLHGPSRAGDGRSECRAAPGHGRSPHRAAGSRCTLRQEDGPLGLQPDRAAGRRLGGGGA